MPNLAELGIRVDTLELKVAALEMAKLTTQSKKTETATDKLTKSFKKMAMQLAGAVGLTTAVVGLYNELKNAIRTYAEFDQAMKNVASVADASRLQMDRLSQAAREMAKTSVFTAREAANAQYYLASAGLKVNQIVDAQRGVMDLAAATQSDLASTSEAVASALSQFSLKAADATRVANVYAAAISASQATQQKLTDAMRYAGPIASKLGQTIEETTAQLMALYGAGLRGEQAGTSLKTALLRLQKPAKEAKDTFVALGVEWEESPGKARKFIDVLADLAKAHITAGEAAAIFGNEAATGALALIGNIDKIKEYEKSITGTRKASEMATQQMSGMKNQLKQLEAAWEELRMTLVGRYAPQMISAIKGITEAINDMTGSLNESDTVLEIANKLMREASGTDKWWHDIPGIRQFYDVLGSIVTLSEGWDPLEAAKAIKQAADESKEWGASFDDLRKALDKVVVVTNKAGETGKRVTGENKQDAKELIKVVNQLQESIKAGSETSLQTQLRHLDELVKKYKNNSKIIALVEQRKNQLIIKSAQDTADEISDLYDKEVEAAQKLGEEAVKSRDDSGKEIVKINKSSLQKMLEDWQDLSKAWDDVAKNLLEGLQSSFADTFKNIFSGAENAWGGLWESFKNIAIQALAAIATRLASGLLANITLNIVPSLSGILGGTSGGISNLFGGEGLGNWLVNAFGTGAVGANGPQIPALLGFTGGAWSGAFGAAGLGAMGGGLLAGAMGGNSQMGSLFGGIGAGAGMLLGGPIGGIIGGLAGSMLGGLMGGEEEDPAIRAREHYQQNLEKFRNNTYDEMTFADLVRQAKIGRLDLTEVKALEAQLREQGKLEWWQPTTEQAYEKVGQAGYDTPEFWKKETIGSAFEQMGAFGDLDIEKIFEALSPEAIDAVGEPLSNLMLGLDNLGLSLEDVIPDITAADLQSGDWKTKLDELNAVTLIQARADKLRAEGANELTIAQQKVTDTIDALLGGFNMTDEETNILIDSLMNSTASYEDLQAKMNEYNDIQEQLKNAHNMDAEEIKKLVERGRQLREELGLGQSEFDKVGEALKDASAAIANDMIPAIRDLINALKEGTNNNNNDETDHTGGMIRHSGGQILHSGGLADLALRSGLITRHGGGRFHTGNLLNGEVAAILQRGEFVTRANSVNMHTLPILQEMNRTGEAPSGGVSFSPTINIPAAPENKEHARKMGKEIANVVWDDFSKRIKRGESLGGIN